MSGDADDRGVGKGKPPKASQFRPGTSGNPRGRPKGRRNFITELEEILTAPVPVTENGKTRRLTSRMALLLRLRKKALDGDGRAMDRFLDLALHHSAEQDRTTSERQLSRTEEDILDRYVEDRIAASRSVDDAGAKKDRHDDPDQSA